MSWPVRPLLILVVLGLGPLAGCLGTGDPLDSASEDPVDPARAVTTYLHDVTEALEDLTSDKWVVEQHRVPMDDGVEIDVWVARPPDDAFDGDFPVILQMTPYYSGGHPLDAAAGGNRLGTYGETFVPRGYAYAIASVRGTGNSGGCFTQGGQGEAHDTAAVIEYLAALSWSNGNVGMMGASYPGTTPQDVWIEAPPALKTIVPIAGISDFYKYNFVNGVPIVIQGLGFNTYYWWSVGLGGPLGVGAQAVGYAYDPVYGAEAIAGEACLDQLDVQEGGVSSTVDGNKDAYWQERDFVRELQDAWDRNGERASVFYIHGLQDWNVKPHMMEDWLPLVQDTGVPFKAWLGQWQHQNPWREDWWNATIVAWFDQFLKGVDTGILDTPTVQVQDDTGLWRHEAAWPPLDTQPLRLYPDATGGLGAQPGTGSASFRDDPAAVDTERRVVWTSEPLDDNLTFSGQPRLVANVTADGPKASLILTLVEVRDGAERPFNYAALSLNHAEDLANGRDDISGLEQAIDLRFFPQDDVVEAGSRLMLVASFETYGAGPGPSLQAVTGGETITLRLDGAWLELPVDTTRTVESPQPCWEDECVVYPAERW